MYLRLRRIVFLRYVKKIQSIVWCGLRYVASQNWTAWWMNLKLNWTHNQWRLLVPVCNFLQSIFLVTLVLHKQLIFQYIQMRKTFWYLGNCTVQKNSISNVGWNDYTIEMRIYSDKSVFCHSCTCVILAECKQCILFCTISGIRMAVLIVLTAFPLV